MKTFFQSMQGAADKIRQMTQPAVDVISRINKPIIGSGFARLVRISNEARKTKRADFGPLPEKYTRGK